MKIILATDHAGFDLKEQIKKELLKQNHDVEDFGAKQNDPMDDYPDFIIPASKFIANNTDFFGIIFGGSGQGEAMAANRIKGIRAAVYYNGPEEIIKLSRKHNNANILSIGARFISFEKTIKVINLWLSTEFEGNRHQRRINKLDK